jgi:hypothetical protein
MEGGETAAGRGAYGFRVDGLDGGEDLMLPAHDRWPLLTVRWVEETSEPTPEQAALMQSTVTFKDGGAVIDHGRSGTIEVQRDPPTATFRIRKVRDPRALVHPYLGGAASIASWWLGRVAFHGGAFVGASGAWVVLGARTAGKSSLLAVLAARGRGVVADDVVVVDDTGIAFAGPRTLDLRRDAAVRLGLGEPLGRVGARDRWRLRLPPVPLELPVRGFVFLSWSDDLEVAEIAGRSRLQRVREGLTIPDRPANAAALLELASLPCLELRRPRDWDAVGETVDALLAVVDG